MNDLIDALLMLLVILAVIALAAGAYTLMAFGAQYAASELLGVEWAFWPTLVGVIVLSAIFGSKS